MGDEVRSRFISPDSHFNSFQFAAPRRTRNSDRPRASDRTMVATGLNRLPSFKSRRTLSPLENEPRERKSSPEKNLSSDREPSANSGLDIETKHFSVAGRRRSFLSTSLFIELAISLRDCVRRGFLDTYPCENIPALLPNASFQANTCCF
jgi:hypothetical protein